MRDPHAPTTNPFRGLVYAVLGVLVLVGFIIGVTALTSLALLGFDRIFWLVVVGLVIETLWLRRDR